MCKPMPLHEAETRTKLTDPAIHAPGRMENLIRREESAGAVEIKEGKPYKESKGQVDYTLGDKIPPISQPVALALNEAKTEHLPPEHGLEQAKLYATSKRQDVPDVFATNELRDTAAVQIGLAATPRQLTDINWDEYPKNEKITADHWHYFGELACVNQMAQGVNDGYLAACDILSSVIIFINQKPKPEVETGVEQPDLKDKQIANAPTREKVSYGRLARGYEAGSFERAQQPPKRVQAMCADLFNLLVKSGGLEQKTFIFCACDIHAD